MSGLTTPPPSAVDQPIKKRKLRKGTQSCWECKRRKSKCTFSRANADEVKCDGCLRRGSPCVSQEYPEDPASNRQQLGDRLGRVKRLLACRSIEDTKSKDDYRNGSSCVAEDAPAQSSSRPGKADHPQPPTRERTVCDGCDGKWSSLLYLFTNS